MMLPQDSLILAYTKLKTRRIRLIITVFISAILFVVLATVSVVINGTIQSIESFSEEGLGKRYLMQVQPNYQDVFSKIGTSQNVARAKAEFEELKKAKAAEAKRLGLEYDPKTELSPIIPQGNPDGTESIDTSHPIGQKIASEIDKATALETKTYVERVTSNYAIRETYNSRTVGSSYAMPGFDGFTISPLIKGKEPSSDDAQTNMFSPKGIAGMTANLQIMSDGLLQPFLLDGATTELQNGEVAVLAPSDAAEEILGLAPLTVNATTEQKLERIKEVREKISATTFQVCLRNKTSRDKQQYATQQAAEIAQNKNVKDYVLPDLIYSVQADPCLDTVITRDKRNADQKKTDEKQAEFDAKFGKVPAVQRLVTFRVVGVTQPQPDFQSFKITDLLGGILTSSLGTGWFIPATQRTVLPEFERDFAALSDPIDANHNVYLEFGTVEQARVFSKEKSCDISSFFMGDPFAECAALDKLFINPFGSSSVALDEFRSTFSTFFSRALMVIALVSALILMGTVGKIISDSRRETAVFRAIGAKRLDIAQIYITYTAILAVFVSVFSVATAVIVARLLQSRFGDEFTLQALVSFNARDLTRTFSMVGIDMGQIGMLVAIIFAGSILSTIIPLLTNLRRNPIKDMRDER